MKRVEVFCEFRVASCELRVRVASCEFELRVVSCELKCASCEFQFASSMQLILCELNNASCEFLIFASSMILDFSVICQCVCVFEVSTECSILHLHLQRVCI